MRQYHDTQHSPYSTQQLFDLVLDVERYPEFLPWCRAARVLERKGDTLIAEMVISFKHITENYVSNVTFARPASSADTGHIDVGLVRGPFERLVNHWTFTPTPEGGSTIGLALAFQFRSKLLDALIGLLFGKAASKMANAFKERADTLYAPHLPH